MVRIRVKKNISISILLRCFGVYKVGAFSVPFSVELLLVWLLGRCASVKRELDVFEVEIVPV